MTRARWPVNSLVPLHIWSEATAHWAHNGLFNVVSTSVEPAWSTRWIYVSAQWEAIHIPYLRYCIENNNVLYETYSRITPTWRSTLYLTVHIVVKHCLNITGVGCHTKRDTHTCRGSGYCTYTVFQKVGVGEFGDVHSPALCVLATWMIQGFCKDLNRSAVIFLLKNTKYNFRFAMSHVGVDKKVQ